MNLKLISLFALTITSLACLCTLPPMLCVAETTIVPPESRISDFEARLALARVLSYKDDTLGDAIKEYQTLLGEKPDNEEIPLELAQIYRRQMRHEEASEALAMALAKNPDSALALLEMADAGPRLGTRRNAVNCTQRQWTSRKATKRLPSDLQTACISGAISTVLKQFTVTI